MARPTRKTLIEALEQRRGSRVICYLTSDRPGADAQIQKDVLPLLFEILSRAGETRQIDLFLYTQGGDTLAAFGLARQLHEFCKTLGVLTPLRCHSAGTLIALGANDIVMTKGATLSPIDPSVVGPLNPVIEVGPGQRQLIPLSVETVAGFKDLVSSDWDIKGEEALSAAFRVLAERVHPLALGGVYRARSQIERLAKTLLLRHRTDDDERLQGIVRELTRNFGSHDYPISRTEARKLLGAQIHADDPETEKLMWELFKDFFDEMELGQAFDPTVALHAARAGGMQGPLKVAHALAFLESRDEGVRAERELELTEVMQQPVMLGLPGLPTPPAAQPTGVRASVVGAGWKRYT